MPDQQQYPVPGKTFISEYPTPSLADFYLWQWKDAKAPEYELPAVGDPHPDTDQYPNHKFIKSLPAKEGSMFEMWLWVADRENEDDYNFTITYPFGSNSAPRYTRTYLVVQDEYEALALGTPDPVYPDAVLMAPDVVDDCDDKNLDAIYVKVTRQFQQFPGPVLIQHDTDSETNSPVIIGQQAVLLSEYQERQTDIAPFTVLNATFIANATTNICTAVAHGFVSPDLVRVTTSTTLPAPLVAGTDYYIRNVTADTFQLSATSGGAIIDITTAGIGTQTVLSRSKLKMVQHGLPLGLNVSSRTTGSNPAGIIGPWIVAITKDTLRLAADTLDLPSSVITSIGTGVHYLTWGAGTLISYEPKGAIWGIKVTSSLLSWDNLEVLQEENGHFPTPTLIGGVTATLYEARDGTGRVQLNWEKDAARNRPAYIKSEIQYGPDGHSNVDLHGIYDPGLRDLEFHGLFMEFHFPNVLNNAIDPPISQTTGTENRKWPYIIDTYSAAKSTRSATEYLEDMAAGQYMNSKVTEWKYGLKRRVNTAVTLL